MNQPSNPIREVSQEALNDILQTMAALELELSAENPMLDQYCVRINNNLRQFPDMIHLLTDEQARPFYTAMVQKAELVLAPKKAKAAAKTTVAPPADVNDLFGF